MQLTNMPKYERYKDSGVEWLGLIPADWKTVKMKYLFRDISIKNKPNESLLSVTQSQGVVPRDWVESRMVMPSGNLGSFKFIEKGDFAISLRSFEGGLEYCHHNGIISPAYTVLKKSKSFLQENYFKHLFKSSAFISELQTSIVGIREGKNISYEELRYSLLPIPSKEKQEQISEYLDQKTAQIDQAIAIKEQQIALLKERKQILIQNAVTQGLNPNAPMKDSGIDWIGQIPEHWGVKRLKNLLSNPLKYGANESGIEYDSELPRYIRITDFSNDGLLNDDKKLSLSWSSGKDYLLNDGDILLARSGATVGKSYQFRTDMSNEKHYSFAGYLIKATPDESIILSDYLNIFLNSDCFNLWKNLIFNKATIENIGADKYSVLPVIVPPIFEQKTILKNLSNGLKPLQNAIDLQQQQIDKLKEYKTTLINSAVTGKIKITEDMIA